MFLHRNVFLIELKEAKMNEKKLYGRVAIVTGGGSGIGAATCKLFAREGARVAVTDINVISARNVAREIKQAGSEAMAAKVDVTRKKEITRLVQKVISRWGQIDIVINNAGEGDIGFFVDSKEETWDSVIAVNLKGTMLFTHAVLPHMIDKKYGRIVNMASIAGKVGAGMQVPYSAAKAGICGFTRALAREVARYNINVNDICPGPIDTPLYGSIATRDSELQKKITRDIVQRRMGQPEEVAAGILFLACDDCRFITGHSLVVDGGVTMI